MEGWKSVLGYENVYRISNYGRLLSNYKNRILKNSVNKDGYVQTVLYKNGSPTHYLVHILVATHFIPNPENKPEVNHKDFDKQNNLVSNLEWNTRMENVEHSMAGGRLFGRGGVIGNKNACKKVKAYKDGKFIKKFNSFNEVAICLKVDRTNVSKVCNGQYKSTKGYVFKHST